MKVAIDHDHHHHHGHEHGHGHHHHEAMKDFMAKNHVDKVLVEHAGRGMQVVFNKTDIQLVPVNINGKAKDVVQTYIDQNL